MTVDPATQPDSTSREAGPAVRRGLIVLLLICGGFAAIAVITAFLVNGPQTGLAAGLAALVCIVSAVGGYFLGIYPRGDFYLLSRLYASMAIRVVPPLLFLLLVRSAWPALFDRGMVSFVVLFYLVGLFSDVIIRYRQTQLAAASRTSAATSVDPLTASRQTLHR